MAAQTSLARKRFRQFLVSVALLHATAISGYHILGVARAPLAFQRAYAWTWMAATIAVVILGLQRVKRARARNVIPPATVSEDADRR